MTIWQAVGLGVLQGATEFLPISSSGHLALAQYWLGAAGPGLVFDVAVHVATLLAILLVLRRRVAALVLAGLSFVPGLRSASDDESDRRWVLLIAAGSVPTAILGLALKDVVEGAHARPALVGGALLVTAALLVMAELLGERTRHREALGLRDALWIGVVQGLAVMPGISRSGATVASALARDVRGDVAVEFSLLLSVPAIVGASLLVALESGGEVGAGDVGPLVAGFAAALVTGAAALRALQWIVTRRRLAPFAVYCGLLGAGAIAVG